MSLSEERYYSRDKGSKYKPSGIGFEEWYLGKDVKEFIKKLKEHVKLCFLPMTAKPPMLKYIDELAGPELTE